MTLLPLTYIHYCKRFNIYMLNSLQHPPPFYPFPIVAVTVVTLADVVVHSRAYTVGCTA